MVTPVILVVLSIASLAQAMPGTDTNKLEELALEHSEQRAGSPPWVHPLHRLQKPSPAIVPNLRGQVTSVSGELLVLDIGVNTGLQVGMVLDVIRLESRDKHIGTVKVTSALNLFPKQAIVTFTPVRREHPLDRLKENELPKIGDQVRSPETLTGGR